MKKLTSLFALVCITTLSCMHQDHNINITYNDAEDYYSMNAYFSKSKTKDAEKYMDKRIGNDNNISFVNTQTDATITLDDHTKFYLQKAPGHIKIKLEKDENSSESFRKIRSMCEGMKKVLTK